jgi:Na+-translocating ferredoxin:NAD+ oxidoreductase subunit C
MLKTFKKGGVHPPENKLSAGKPIEVLPPPASVFIPLPSILVLLPLRLLAVATPLKWARLLPKAAVLFLPISILPFPGR